MCSRSYRGRIPWPAKMFMALVAIPSFLLLGTLAAWLLWNALMPTVFQLPMLTYWQMMGIMVLGRLIFGGHGGPGRHHRFPRKPRYQDRDEWKAHMKERFRDGFSRESQNQDRFDDDRPLRENASKDPEDS